MKYIIASDIHGCFTSAQKIADIFEREHADRLLILGDLLYHGPRNALPEEYDTKKTAAILNTLKDKIMCVRGNCDAEVDQMVLEFPITADYMQIPVDGIVLFATHGHHYGPDHQPPLGLGDVLLSGHTHVPMCAAVNGMLCVNPGSTSIPKGGSRKSYAVLNGRHLELRHLEDDSVYLEKDL